METIYLINNEENIKRLRELDFIWYFTYTENSNNINADEVWEKKKDQYPLLSISEWGLDNKVFIRVAFGEQFHEGDKIISIENLENEYYKKEVKDGG